MLPLLLARPGPSSTLALKRTFSSSLPAQSRIRPSRQPSYQTPSAPTPSTSTSASSSSSSSSSSVAPTRYTLGGLQKASSNPFSFSGPTSIVGSSASFSTAAVDGQVGSTSGGGGGVFDLISGSEADRRSAAILNAQKQLENLSLSSSTTSPSSSITDDPSFALSDPLLLPFPRPNSSSASLLVPLDAPSTSPYSYSLPPLDLSSAWFTPSHASHPSTTAEPSLAEQHARIVAAGGTTEVLGPVERERRREEEQRLEMEMFRMMAVTRLEVEEDRGWGKERWIGEEETEDREVTMTSVMRKRKLMMKKHKYKKRRKAQATMRKRQNGK